MARRYIPSEPTSRLAIWARRMAGFAFLASFLAVIIVRSGLLENRPALATFAGAPPDQRASTHRPLCGGRKPRDRPPHRLPRRRLARPHRQHREGACRCASVACKPIGYGLQMLMIRRFRHKGLEALFRTGSAKGLDAQFAGKLHRMLARLNDGPLPDAMSLPGYPAAPAQRRAQGHLVGLGFRKLPAHVRDRRRGCDKRRL